MMVPYMDKAPLSVLVLKKCLLLVVDDAIQKEVIFGMFSCHRVSEIKEKIENVQEEIRNLDMDLEEHQGENGYRTDYRSSRLLHQRSPKCRNRFSNIIQL